jgi:hypothetical protein
MNTRPLLFAILVAAVAACSSASSDPSTGDDQNATEGCAVFSEREGRNLTAAELAALNDPVAKLVLSGAGCPGDLVAIQQKLRQTDATGCAADNASGPPSGTTVRFVSEDSQQTGSPGQYRAVVSRACGGRSTHELLISVFGVTADQDLPGDVEMIGEDKVKGVFQFYSRENGKWTFFGSSADFVGNGYDCNADGACLPKEASKTRCATCHSSGGLNMKELESPWVSWNTDPSGTSLPGSGPIQQKNAKILGTMGTGIDLEEQIVEPANNGDWTPARVALLKSKGAKELLRPLFCTTEINLRTGGGTVPSAFSQLPADFFVDRTWNAFVALPVNGADYAALISANQQILSDGQSQMRSSKGDGLTDSFFGFIFPQRSSQDRTYQQTLVNQKLVDDDFVKDVLAIDFTRPVYSPTRCALLDSAPDLTGNAITPDAIRAGFKTNLANATDAGAQLLASLGNTSDAQQHAADVTAFLNACKARPSKELLADAMTMVSHTRKAMKRARHATPDGTLGILEFPDTLPQDGISEKADALDPKTCTFP